MGKFRVRSQRIRSAPIMFAAAALICAGALVTIGTNSPARATGGVTETGGGNNAGDTIEQSGETSYPSTFAGVEAVDDTDVTLYTSGTATTLDRYAEGVASANGVTLTEVSVSQSWTQMNSTIQAIAADKATLASEGINLSYWGIDVPSNSVFVVLATAPMPHPTKAEYMADAQTDLDSLLGSGAATVTDVNTAAGSFLSDTRDDDSSPWNGGLEIATPTSYCTDSWKVIYSTGTGVLTAGQCGTGSVNVKGYPGRVMGTVHAHHFSDPSTDWVDSEVIGTGDSSANPNVWNTETTSLTPTAVADPCKGCVVSFDGAVTGQKTV